MERPPRTPPSSAYRLKVGSGMAMLVGRGGNLAVSTGPDGVVLVDGVGLEERRVRRAATLHGQVVAFAPGHLGVVDAHQRRQDDVQFRDRVHQAKRDR